MARDVDFFLSCNEDLRENILELLSEGLTSLEESFQNHQKRGNIQSGIGPRDLTLLCTSLSKGLIQEVAMGMDRDEAHRLWLTGFTQLTVPEPNQPINVRKKHNSTKSQ